jgi:uncharacterized membrane protein
VIASADYVIGLTISFIVFTFGSLLVAIQVASGQMTPRIIATTLLRDNIIRCTAGVFVYALLLAIAVKIREETIPHFLESAVGLLGIVSVVAFLFMIDHTARLLRPISIVWRVAQEGVKVIEDVYPELVADIQAPSRPSEKLDPPDRTILHRGTSAIVIAVNLKALVAEAKRVGCIIEFAPRVGDFVAVGEPLFLLRGNAAAIDERRLRGQVAFGRERTIEQDSTFAFRVIVDIALKALSKAISDPTTAVIAIDQIHRLLRTVGKRALHDSEISDSEGRLRVIFRTPDWGDFVSLAFSEIRQCGAENFQVTRRLYSMTENLLKSLPKHRHPELRRELDLLDRAVARIHAFPEDRAFARVPDSQGVGGS